MALALSAQRLSQWLIRGAGPIQAWLLAVLSLAGALIAARRGLGELVPPLLCTALIGVLQGVLPLHSASTILGT